MKNIYILTLAAVLLSSCVKHKLGNDIAGEGEVLTSLAVSLDGLAESRANEVVEDKIMSLDFFVFSADGVKVMEKRFPKWADATIEEKRVILTQGEGYTFVAVANLNDANATLEGSSLLDEIKKLSDFDNLTLSIANNAIDRANCVTMMGILTNQTVTPSTKKLLLSLTRIASKQILNVKFNPDVATDGFELVGYGVVNMPAITWLKARVDVSGNPTTDYIIDNPLVKNVYFDVAAPGGGKFSEADVMVTEGSFGAAKQAYFYMAESLRGTNTNADQKTKLSTAPAGAGIAVIQALYTKAGASGKLVTYQIPLGRNATNDYTVVRNGKYSYNITVKGIDKHDVSTVVDERVNIKDFFIAEVPELELDGHNDARPILARALNGESVLTFMDGSDATKPFSGTWLKMTRDYKLVTGLESTLTVDHNDQPNVLSGADLFLNVNENLGTADRFVNVKIVNTQTVEGKEAVTTIIKKYTQKPALRYGGLGFLVENKSEYNLKETSDVKNTVAALPWGFSGNAVPTLADWQADGMVNTTELVKSGVNHGISPFYTSNSNVLYFYRRNVETYAARYCRDKGANWYLPSLQELQRIFVLAPAINSGLTGVFVTSTPNTGNSGVYTVNPATGATAEVTRATASLIKCVRTLTGVSTPPTAYVAPAVDDYTISRTITTNVPAAVSALTPSTNGVAAKLAVSNGYVNASGTAAAAVTAVTYANAVTGCTAYKGISGTQAGLWRLPTQREAMIVNQFNKTSQFFSAFGAYWTQTVDGASAATNVWTAHSGTGVVSTLAKTGSAGALCVRDMNAAALYFDETPILGSWGAAENNVKLKVVSTVTGAWSISSNSTWATIATQSGGIGAASQNGSGAGKSTFYLNFEKNTTTAARTATITLSYGTNPAITRTLGIVQQGSSVFTVSYDGYTSNIITREFMLANTNTSGAAYAVYVRPTFGAGTPAGEKSYKVSINYKTAGHTNYITLFTNAALTEPVAANATYTTDQTFYMRINGWAGADQASIDAKRTAALQVTHTSTPAQIAQAEITVVQKYCLGIAYRFAKGNIIADGKGGITIGEPHDQGLVFKWGSLVGIRLPDSGANWSSPFVAGDVVFRPDEFTGTITNDWTTVPCCTTDFGDYSSTATDHLSRAHTPANIARGIGDICRYMGVIDGANWRMPTQSEWNELYGSDQDNKGQAVRLPSSEGWIAGNYYPLSGRAMGVGRDGVKIIGSDAAARVGGADPNTCGAVFLPASGYREATVGAIYVIGSEGRYWSATAMSAGNGYRMGFNSSNVWPQWSNTRTHGFSVRCIRE